MANVNEILPELPLSEQNLIAPILEPMNPETAQKFAMMYRGQRRDSTNILIFALVGFFGIAGIHRFILDEIGMGVLYLLTGGLCGIGTIIDMVNHRSMTEAYNVRKGREIAELLGHPQALPGNIS